MISDQSILEDLDWYLQESDSAIGVRSNFLAIIRQGCNGRQNAATNDAENGAIAALFSIGRKRDIERTLQRLPEATQRHLIAMVAPHSSRDFPHTYLHFEEDDALAAYLSKDPKGLELLCLQKTSATLSNPEAVRFSTLKTQVKLAKQHAFHLYRTSHHETQRAKTRKHHS